MPADVPALATPAPPAAAAKKPKKKARWGRRLVRAGAVSILGVELLWIAIHDVPGFGPWLADTARDVFGPSAVAWAEDVAYGVADDINRLRYGDAPPVTYWEAPTEVVPVAPTSSAAAPPGSNGTGAGAGAGSNEVAPPAAFAAPYPTVASAADGQWISLGDVTGKTPAMFKTIVHPDPKRSFAAVAIVAMDTRHFDLHLVAGRNEPSSQAVPFEKRPGVVPDEDQKTLVAAFNGGFKATHGHWGMKVGSDVYLQARDVGCTIALLDDGTMKVGTWTALKEREPHMTWYRQTPPCLVENGETNPALEMEYAKGWGATVSGDTVIRRSALGVDAAGQFVFFALGDALTAQSLSRAMKAAGARDAAQLDVNYAYPRFLVYGRNEANDKLIAKTAIIPDIKFRAAEYVTEGSLRDFFYVTRR